MADVRSHPEQDRAPWRFRASLLSLWLGLALGISPLTLSEAASQSVDRQRAVQQPQNGQPILGSRRLAAPRGNLDDDWDRVRNAIPPRAAVRRFLAQATPRTNRLSLLHQVNAYVNRRVRYVPDQQNFGAIDYWASAIETLTRASGDCEDVAIAKYHLLAEAGVPASSMFLVLARDPRTSSDHAMLIVQESPRLWLLDNRTDRLLDGSVANGYVPVLSFSENQRWLHVPGGRPRLNPVSIFAEVGKHRR